MGNLCNPPAPEVEAPLTEPKPVNKPVLVKQLTRPSIKATMEWEKRTGKRYKKLTPDERPDADKEIMQLAKDLGI
ncbi:hypothetical protein KFE25_008750 [Diacronema lutheri]|uniref:Uncharacterized protein n=1 Tax=Diacronema lutheri TaxID=2081491 RepID=A0A8J5Y380_DIALT|nr:hypothetical protein KFE25_008750 [Diacronema lutheri]